MTYSKGYIHKRGVFFSVSKNITIRLIIAVLAQILAAFGIALLIKAGIGLGPIDAFNTAMSQLTGLTVGTMAIIVNVICVFGQIAIWRGKLAKIQYLQFPVAFLFGSMIDFFLIYVLTFDLNSYFTSLIVFILGLIIMSIGIGAINTSNVIFSPIEGFCQAIVDVTGFKFVNCRWGADIVLILLTVVCIVIGADNVLREGTIAVMLFFSPILNFCMNQQIKLFNKFNLI